jgi:hypothetical protein
MKQEPDAAEVLARCLWFLELGERRRRMHGVLLGLFAAAVLALLGLNVYVTVDRAAAAARQRDVLQQDLIELVVRRCGP